MRILYSSALLLGLGLSANAQECPDSFAEDVCLDDPNYTGFTGSCADDAFLCTVESVQVSCPVCCSI